MIVPPGWWRNRCQHWQELILSQERWKYYIQLKNSRKTLIKLKYHCPWICSSWLKTGLATASCRNSCFLFIVTPLKLWIWIASVTCLASELLNVPVICIANSTRWELCVDLQCAHMNDASALFLNCWRCSFPRAYIFRDVSPLYSAMMPRDKHSRHVIL